jgi:7-keto-8-aminopelargonate synthetase-like enzyme
MAPSSPRLRNLAAVQDLSRANYAEAIRRGLMQVSLAGREGRRVTLPTGQRVTEFINCSYLALDTRADVIARGQAILSEWGVHLCCARSRFSIGPLEQLEEGLSELWGGRAITFPSVTTTHMSAMPLLPESLRSREGGVTFLYDRLAHASMQYLRPVLAVEHTVEVVPHNDLGALEEAVKAAHARGDAVIYVADGVYSMGGLCPLDEVLAMSRRLEFALYLDDAHGTSIYGERGEGSVLSRIGRTLPENVSLTFSLSKGYGCNGGGILVPDREAEARVRTFGMTYAFSAPLDFSVVGAALASLELHRSGEVRRLQAELRRKVELFDRLAGRVQPFSPIRMVEVGDEQRAIELADALKARGFFTSVTFFPIVPRGAAKLRLCLGVDHADEDLEAVVGHLRELGALP